jgi:hypothetical protein
MSIKKLCMKYHLYKRSMKIKVKSLRHQNIPKLKKPMKKIMKKIYFFPYMN